MKLDGIVHYEKTVNIVEEAVVLSYRMFECEAESSRKIYCLMIELISPNEYDECTLQDIALSEKMAMRIWRLFIEQTVTPCTAADILEDLLSDWLFLYAD